MDDITYFLKEDLQDIGDITSDLLFSDETAEGVIFTKNDCILAGIKHGENVFNKTGAQLKALRVDGDVIKRKTEVARVSGSVRSILSGERLVLNILGRMSGIATVTRNVVDMCTPLNPSIEIAATRKTTPGFRKYEKEAVVIGGGFPHRMGLYDAVLIKDNHLKLIGSVSKAIERIREKQSDIPIEIEVENETDALLAARLYPDVIMLDNFSPRDAGSLVEKIKKIHPNVIIELSGGITLDNIQEYASFSDRISLGMLTHTIKNIDFSLELV